ncbi:MAG TPA: hypothetical protein VKE40_04060 [Gemmataceae bacterium]|nr:hypothetical protein [Gemmataceae bacterium]
MSKKCAFALILLAFIGGLLVADLHERVYAQEAKGPKWQHGLMLRVRKADQPDFDKNTPKVGVEVFVDENNGNLIYITDTGSISVVKK